MPKSADLAFGILLVLTGLYALAWLPAVKRRLEKRQQTGERTTEEVRRELRNLKLITAGALLGGGALICIYVFGLST